MTNKNKLPNKIIVALQRVFGSAPSLIFYAGLCVFIAVAIFFVGRAMDKIENVLGEYENSLPKYAVEEIFDEYFATPDFDQLMLLADCKAEGFNTNDDLKRYFEERVNGKKITWVYVAGSDKTKINVKADGEKFAQYSIKVSPQVTENGFATYELDTVRLYYKAPYSVKIKIPFNYSVSVNGVMLGEEYKTATGITSDLRDTIPEGTYKFSYDEYTVEDMLFEHKPVAYNSKNEKTELVYDEESKMFCADFAYDEALKNEYSDFVIDGVEVYASRIQNAATMSQVRKYFEIGTETYERIKDNPGSFVWDYDSCEFENQSATDFYAYDENTFSCIVKVTQVMHWTNKEDYRENVNVTIYLRKGDDGEFMIYDLITNL